MNPVSSTNAARPTAPPQGPNSADLARAMQQGQQLFNQAMAALKGMGPNASAEQQQAMGDQLKAAAEKLQELAKQVTGRQDAADALNGMAKQLADAFKAAVGNTSPSGADSNGTTTPGQAQPPTTPFDFLIPCQE